MFKNFEITEDNADMVAVGLLAWCALTGVLAGVTGWIAGKKLDKGFDKLKKIENLIEDTEV